MYLVSCIEMRCLFVLVWICKILLIKTKKPRDLVICSPSRILGFGVQLEGLIDLGPNWGYKYKLYPLRTTESYTEHPMFSYSHKGRKDMELVNVGSGNEKDQAISPSDNLHFEEKTDSVNNLSTVAVQFEEKNISTHTNKRSKKDVIKKTDVRSQTVQKFQKKSDKKLKNKKKRNAYDDGKSNESDKDVSNSEVKKDIIRHGNTNRDQTEIDRLDNFMKVVYKKSMKVWKKMSKLGRSNKVKGKVNTLKNYYKRNYRQFMNLSEKHKLKTKLGTQKFVLNAIETSNRIMQRLVNSLPIYENYKNGKNGIFQHEVEKEKWILYAHACKKFGVCRTRDDFGEYLIELINIILETDNAKIKQAADALTEVVKTNDFTQIIDHTTQDKLRKQMTNIELWDPLIVKSMFVIVKNVLSHKNQPMVIMSLLDQELSNKTVAFHEIIDTLNKNIYKSNNVTAWNKIIKQLEEWRDGSRKEIQTVFHSLIELIKEGLEKIDTTAKQEIDKNTNIILKPMVSKIFET